MLFAAAVESPQPIRHVRPVNEWLPVHGGASGRALLAFLPEAEREAILEGPLEPVTENTVTRACRVIHLCGGKVVPPAGEAT
jgi:DNA-binding IclR family transcriptional regulator